MVGTEAAERMIFVEGSPCVVLDSVSMSYNVPTTAASGDVPESIFARSVRKISGKPAQVRVNALNELSLVVERGESVGIIGRNGSGKSTLMKLICGQEKPTGGGVYASSTPILLGVNAALVPDLSGDQNIILGCLAMGMDRTTINQRFDSIVEMSGLAGAIHLPMKSYSSGMGSRLRFAIAAAVDPEILLVDEALNTGDAQFIERSQRRMAELRENAGSVFIVSHTLSTIEDMCTRVLWLDYGDLIMDGDPKATTTAYKKFISRLGKGYEMQAYHLRDASRKRLIAAQVTSRVSGRRRIGDK